MSGREGEMGEELAFRGLRILFLLESKYDVLSQVGFWAEGQT